MGRYIQNTTGELDSLEALGLYIQVQDGLNAAKGLEIRRLLFDLSRRGVASRDIVRLEQAIMRLERAFAEQVSDELREFRRRECIEIISDLSKKIK